ncbi:glyoxalase/bleomycin resistance/dioxygenase family protein [Veronia nyctiphanis]|uniref:Glyoxalase/bleomycin resistance/dioxygenase family protein n=1 Tax=Veronia nyctiphanis TaxID=1278244 RepID=A0A4Q0YT36_9GAMM|nr:glyoxalase/bleomycin resistance/dioxygenase family protein [Veronia nyctiphanis]RXJ74356.1 glyoxalase/bleomycin resistance/dioxygenase family protein [Veronia nyctiphanis]
MKPTAILFHVPHVDQGIEWYKKAFPNAKFIYLPDLDFVALDSEGFSIEIIQGDNKVSAGKRGTVVYWSVQDFEEAVEHFLSLGGLMYRKPLILETGMGMCQIEDPFGNLIGLRGMVKNHQTAEA